MRPFVIYNSHASSSVMNYACGVIAKYWCVEAMSSLVFADGSLELALSGFYLLKLFSPEYPLCLSFYNIAVSHFSIFLLYS